MCFTTDPPHLCKDVAARLKRRLAQKEAVIDILERSRTTDHLTFDEMAEAIVTKLARMGVAND